MDTNKKPIYPFEPWNVSEDHLDLAMNYRNETTFALSNGYIGTRGTHEEAYDFDEQHGLEGNFLNGLYEQEHVRYGEWNFGFPTESQTILNVPNCKTIRLVVDGEPMDIRTGTLQNYRRTLDMNRGQVVRSFEWTAPNGKTVRVENTRFVSLAHKNRMAQRYSVTPVNFSGTLTLRSALDADVENHTRTTNPLVDYGPFGRHLLPDALTADDTTMTCQSTAVNSKLAMACGSVHLLSEAAAATRHQANDVNAWIEYDFAAEQGHTITLEKLTVYTDSLDMDKGAMLPFVSEELAAFVADGYCKEFAAHAAQMEHFWETADIRVDGDVPLQQGLRFNLYHIMQASGRDGRTGMGAKGLSGEGYEGHYFWDTEMYVLPVFVYTQPELARSLLDYRYSTLDKARDRARVLGHPIGALYPWRTINGEEVTTDGADYISQLTTHAIEYFAAVEKEFDELGGVLDDAATAEAANSADSLWNSNGDLYTANGISKSTVETYLLNAQKAKAILNLTYGADGTSPVTEAEYTDYVNNDCYYVETVQFPLVNYSSYSLATDDQKSQIEDIAAQCLAELNEQATAETASNSPVHCCHELRAPGHERHGQHDRVCPGGLLRRFQAVHPGRSLQLWRRRLQQPDRPAG